MSTRNPKLVSLDELAAEKLSPEIVEAIDAIAVELEEVKADVYLGIHKGKFIAKVQVNIPIKKLLIISALIGFFLDDGPESLCMVAFAGSLAPQGLKLEPNDDGLPSISAS